MSNQSMKLLVGLFLIIVFILSANVISGIIFPTESVITPQVISDPEKFQSPIITISQTFPFENSVVSLSFPVNVSILENTKKTGKIVSILNNDSGSSAITERYRAMVMDPQQDQIFSDLLEELHKIRHLKDLSEDEFLELIVVYVQSFRYESLEQNPVKFPVETIVDAAGDCDDRSLLLAGLLAREGYSVALLSFGPEAHMATGVSSSDYFYKKSGYSFIETTNYSFVGVPTDSLGGNLSLNSDPTIIVISNGTKLYKSGKETRFIHESYLNSDLNVKDLSSQLKSLNDDLTAKQIRISELNSQIDDLRNSGDLQAYNSQVRAYTTLVLIYNSRLASYRQIYAEYERFADIHNYILEHKYDRRGVYDYIKNNISS